MSDPLLTRPTTDFRPGGGKNQRVCRSLSPAAVLVPAVIATYLAAYLTLRQTAARGTIFIASPASGGRVAHDYRAINLAPAASKWVHLMYSPVIALDRKWTGTVVTLNVP